MFTISNARKVGDLSFVTAKGRPVKLVPGRSLEFETDELNDGLLRTMVGTGSFYKVLADGDDAQAMIDAAKARKPKKALGSPLVEGSYGPRHMERSEVDRVVEIRDLKKQSEAAGGKPREKPVDAPAEPPPAPATTPPPGSPPVTPGVFITEEVKEPSPAKQLLAKVDDEPWTELVEKATAILGDKLPTRPGRKSIKDALTAFVEAEEAPPQQQAAE